MWGQSALVKQPSRSRGGWSPDRGRTPKGCVSVTGPERSNTRPLLPPRVLTFHPWYRSAVESHPRLVRNSWTTRTLSLETSDRIQSSRKLRHCHLHQPPPPWFLKEQNKAVPLPQSSQQKQRGVIPGGLSRSLPFSQLAHQLLQTLAASSSIHKSSSCSSPQSKEHHKSTD